MKKRITSLLLVSLFIISLFTSVYAESDIKGHYAEPVLQSFKEKGLLETDAKGRINPDKTLTRAEFISLANKVAVYMDKSVKVKKYKDVLDSDWFKDDIAKGLYPGYLRGTSYNTMSPDAIITKEEAIALTARIMGLFNSRLNIEYLDIISDKEEVDEWAQGIVANAVGNGIPTVIDGKVNPKDTCTLAESVILLEKIITDERIFSTKGDYGPDGGMRTYKSAKITADGVNLKNIIIEGDLEITDTVTSGNMTLNNVIVKGRLIINGGGSSPINIENSEIALLTAEKDAVAVKISDKSYVPFVKIQANTGTMEINSASKISTLIVNGNEYSITLGDDPTIGSVTFNGNKDSIGIPSSAIVHVLTFNGEFGSQTGLGVVSSVQINRNNNSMATRPLYYLLGGGITVQMAGSGYSNY